MITYLYECPIHGEFEFQHTINERLDLCPKCQEEKLPDQPVKRLIASGGAFILVGGGWASESYSKK